MDNLTPKKSKAYACKNFHFRIENIPCDFVSCQAVFDFLSEQAELLVVGKDKSNKNEFFEVFLVLLTIEGGLRVC